MWGPESDPYIEPDAVRPGYRAAILRRNWQEFMCLGPACPEARIHSYNPHLGPYNPTYDL